MAISTDLSPSTGRSYVPLPILHTANWEHARLRHIISIQSSGGKEKEKKDLGIGISGTELYASHMHPKLNFGDSNPQQYYLVPHTTNPSGLATPSIFPDQH
ncbi:hypothetical protein V5O48_007522 [Marasmius crinis-equi]|uniref:Uncharacterized protein n=1 Tax=Marasmius crinis-equi TaxID=585013 RepID=A0ABR3FGF9_9AGAR